MFSQVETATDAAESSPAIRLKFASPQPTVSAIILRKDSKDGHYSGLNVRLYVSLTVLLSFCTSRTPGHSFNLA